MKIIVLSFIQKGHFCGGGLKPFKKIETISVIHNIHLTTDGKQPTTTISQPCYNIYLIINK